MVNWDWCFKNLYPISDELIKEIRLDDNLTAFLLLTSTISLFLFTRDIHRPAMAEEDVVMAVEAKNESIEKPAQDDELSKEDKVELEKAVRQSMFPHPRLGKTLFLISGSSVEFYFADSNLPYDK